MGTSQTITEKILTIIYHNKPQWFYHERLLRNGLNILMKKILFCASRTSHLENFHRDYLQYFHSLGWEVHVAAQGELDLPEVDHFYPLNFSKSSFPLKNLSTVLQLKNILKQEQYDVIQPNATLAGLVCRTAVMLLPKQYRPTVIQICHGYLFDDDGGLKSRLYLTCERLTSKPVDLLLTMNHQDYEIAQKYHLGKQILPIHGMGIHPEKFPPLTLSQQLEIREKYNLDPNSFTFLTIGEFSNRKNQEMIIRAFYQAVQDNPKMQLLLAGEGQQMESCKKLVKELHLDTKVIFCGYVSDVNSLYRTADALVAASFYEGLPFNVMEALFCGLPCIVSDVKGHQDLIQHKNNGLLFPIGNSSILAKQLEELSCNIVLYEKIKENAFLPNSYWIEMVKQEVLHAYHMVLDDNLKS